MFEELLVFVEESWVFSEESGVFAEASFDEVILEDVELLEDKSSIDVSISHIVPFFRNPSLHSKLQASVLEWVHCEFEGNALHFLHVLPSLYSPVLHLFSGNNNMYKKPTTVITSNVKATIRIYI